MHKVQVHNVKKELWGVFAYLDKKEHPEYFVASRTRGLFNRTYKAFDPAIRLDGWVKRNEAPPLLEFGVQALMKNQEPITDSWREAKIEIEYELLGLEGIYKLTTGVHLASQRVVFEFEDFENIDDDFVDH